MIEAINERVSVISVYNRERSAYLPVRLRWHGQTHPITKLGYHHTYRQGRVIIHVFSVSNNAMFFRLEFNTETLEWWLKQISDGLTT